MIEESKVGKVCMLNAPWHAQHANPVLVVHARTGMSEDYFGRKIYHIATGNFSEIDWDTEFVDAHLVRGMDVSWALKPDCQKVAGAYHSKYMECLRNGINEGYMMNDEMLIYGVVGNNHIPDGFLTCTQIHNLGSYFHDGLFIEQQPPN